MKLTRDIINMIQPNHAPTVTCDDQHHVNGSFKVEEFVAPNRKIVIERHFEYAPSCKRCFLLDFEELETEYIEKTYHIKIIPTVVIDLIQPKLKITLEEE